MLNDIIEAIKKRKLEKQRKLEEQQKQLKEQERNEPKYMLDKLYVGEIVLFERQAYLGGNVNESFYKPVKKYAIFTKIGYEEYLHLKSGQKLQKLGGWDAIVRDYTVRDIKKFQERFPIFMRKNNLSPFTRVSLECIEQLEDEMNSQLAPDQQNIVDLFK